MLESGGHTHIQNSQPYQAHMSTHTHSVRSNIFQQVEKLQLIKFNPKDKIPTHKHLYSELKLNLSEMMQVGIRRSTLSFRYKRKCKTKRCARAAKTSWKLQSWLGLQYGFRAVRCRFVNWSSSELKSWLGLQCRLRTCIKDYKYTTHLCIYNLCMHAARTSGEVVYTVSEAETGRSQSSTVTNCLHSRSMWRLWVLTVSDHRCKFMKRQTRKVSSEVL